MADVDGEFDPYPGVPDEHLDHGLALDRLNEERDWNQRLNAALAAAIEANRRILAGKAPADPKAGELMRHARTIQRENLAREER